MSSEENQDGTAANEWGCPFCYGDHTDCEPCDKEALEERIYKLKFNLKGYTELSEKYRLETINLKQTIKLLLKDGGAKGDHAIKLKSEKYRIEAINLKETIKLFQKECDAMGEHVVKLKDEIVRLNQIIKDLRAELAAEKSSAFAYRIKCDAIGALLDDEGIPFDTLPNRVRELIRRKAHNDR